jgi:hypothetical protein
MDLRDLIVTPLFLILIYWIAYSIRFKFTDTVTRPYFIPALTVKLIGAIGVGMLYQFYYGGGDTFMYHTYGSRKIWEAFIESPQHGFQLLLSDGSYHHGIYKYSSGIYFFDDPASYAVIRFAGFIDLFTFSTYSATALLFAAFCFIGMWMFFLTFYRQYPHLHKGLAIGSLFIPSVFFWGSGILKDTLTLGCVGIATFMIYKIFIQRKINVGYIVILLLVLYGLYVIKIYIVLTLLPSAIVLVFISHFSNISSFVLKVLMFPFVISLTIVLGYFAMLKAGEDNPRYSLDALAKTAQVTSYDIRYWSGRDAGSGYSLGELDGTWQSMLRLAPEAINVSLFRPYLWEVRNPLMLLSAIESLILLIFTVYVIMKARFRILNILRDPNILFCLVFSITFAFAVGVSTYNFGTLTRYKIPLMPFYSIALVLISNYSKSDKKDDLLEITE